MPSSKVSKTKRRQPAATDNVLSPLKKQRGRPKSTVTNKQTTSTESCSSRNLDRRDSTPDVDSANTTSATNKTDQKEDPSLKSVIESFQQQLTMIADGFNAKFEEIEREKAARRRSHLTTPSGCYIPTRNLSPSPSVSPSRYRRSKAPTCRRSPGGHYSASRDVDDERRPYFNYRRHLDVSLDVHSTESTLHGERNRHASSYRTNYGKPTSPMFDKDSERNDAVNELLVRLSANVEVITS